MRKDGKPLEQAVKIIQEALKDKPNTEVLVDQKLINTSGRERQFDVIIKSMINGIEIMIVVECKEYGRKISVDKIEAFGGKCKRVKGINKKIFVSVHGYQADAVNAAQDFEIDIYTLNELNVNKIEIAWAMETIRRIVHVRQRFFFTNLIFVTEDYTKEFDPISFFITTPETYHFIAQYLFWNLHHISHKLIVKQVNQVGLSFEEDVTLIDTGGDWANSNLKEILISFIPTKELIDYVTKIEVYKKNNDQDSTAHVVTQETKEGMIFKFVITKDSLSLFRNGSHNKRDFYDTGFKKYKEEE